MIVADKPTFPRICEIEEIVKELTGMDKDNLKVLYENVSRKLHDRNGYVVEYNHLLTSILGYSTNPLLL